MSLNKQKMVREIGRRTRLSNQDVQAVIETLVEVWTEELVGGGRIEIEHFLVLDVQTKGYSFKLDFTKRIVHRLSVRASKSLHARLNAP